MARDWIRTNRNRGNVLRMDAKDLASANATITPTANKTFLRVLDGTGTFTLTIDGSESLPGDEIILLVEATGATTVSVDGDAAPGSLVVGAGGVGAAHLVNGGTESTPFFVSVVPLT